MAWFFSVKATFLNFYGALKVISLIENRCNGNMCSFFCIVISAKAEKKIMSCTIIQIDDRIKSQREKQNDEEMGSHLNVQSYQR